MNQIISFLFHVLFFFTPLLLWPKSSEVFEFPKMLFVYGLTILITSTWILSWIKAKKITIQRTPLDLPIFIFLLFQILSTIFSIDPHTSLWGYYSRFHGGLASTISYVLLFYAFTSHGLSSHKGKVHQYIQTILISTSLISVYAILEHFGIDKDLWVQDVQSRVFSTLGQPNWLSAYLVAILPLPIFLFLKDKNFLYPILILLIIMSIIFTKSQSGLAATATVLFFILTHIAIKQKKVIHFIVTLLISITSILLIKPQLITQPLSSLNKINPFYSTTYNVVHKDLETRGNGGSDSMAIRRVVWQGAIDLGKEHPFLGTGVETFAYSYYNSRPAEHNLLSEWNFLYNKAHNEYLNLLANTGFLGLGSYLLLITWIIRWWIKNNPNPTSTALFIGWLSILITNFFGFSVVAVGLLFFLFPALNVLLINTKPKKIEIQILTGHSLIALTTIASAVYLLTSLFNTFRADLSYQLSKSHISANQNRSALDLLQKSINLQPNQPLFLAKLAELESKISATIFLQLDQLPSSAKQTQEQYENQAMNHVTQAVNLNPHNLNLLKSKARVEIYLSNIDTNYTQKALNTLLQASILAPTDPKLLLNIGILYQTVGNSSMAITTFQKAIELKPSYPEASVKLQELQL